LSVILTASTIGGLRIRNPGIFDVLFIFFTLVFEFAAINDIEALLPVCFIIDLTLAVASEFGIDADF